MYYPNELAHFKITNFKHPDGLLIFKDQPTTTAPEILAKKQVEIRLTQRLLKFCQHTIHGVNHIWEPRTKPAVRIFWCLVVTTALIGCIILYNTVTQRHREGILVTVVESSHLPIHTIRFPAVAVCPLNHVNWMRYHAAETRFLPRYSAKEAKTAFYNLVILLERMTFTRLNHVEEFLKIKKVPRSVRNIELSEVAKFMSLRCDEIFSWCVFDKTQMDCCKIFVPEYTGRGECLVFNSVISKESRIKKVLIKEEDEWSDTLFHILQKNTHNSLMVTPRISETSRNTRHIDPAKRKWLFPVILLHLISNRKI
ncbi:pickpocket protein 19-like [Musca domestica]|uniref:Pickpocket protein 19-like n=1 Tax=Musca domestica TaxID=7370 RepID=A0A9J7IG50_MUSDO|nr:pickpocket protein 19-like [Musca domestica]